MRCSLTTVGKAAVAAAAAVASVGAAAGIVRHLSSSKRLIGVGKQGKWGSGGSCLL